MVVMSYIVMLAWVGGAVCGALAFVAVRQAPRLLAPWLFAVGMLGFAAESICFGLTLTAASPEKMIYWQKCSLVVVACLPGCWLLFSLSYARANYREHVRAWRYTLLAAFGLPVALAVGFGRQLIVAAGQSDMDAPWLFHLGVPGAILNLLYLAGAILALMNLEGTFRAAIGTMRWRIKYMVLGLGVIFTVQVYVGSQVLLFHNNLNLSLQLVKLMALLLGSLLMLRALLRRGHFDADIYPPRSVPYKSVTVLLAGAYLLSVGVFAMLVEFLGDGTSFMLKAFVLLLALVFIAILLVSDRARLMARRFASRHFQKPLYDYRSLWRRFTGETASCVRQTELCEATVKLTSDIFRVLSVSLWLVDEKKENLIFAASTFLSGAKATALAPSSAGAASVMRALDHHPDPVDIDASREPWADVLRRCHPDEFKQGGRRVCVPLMNGGQILGLLILGDRVEGLPFTGQDFDLMKCVADSMAAGLRNIQLSQKLLQAGQLEAFQTMSSFFVHDLKNTASTLSLMLQNLPVHFDDPGFREDTLRGITKTVAHINRLIERLGQLRAGLQIRSADADFNELVLKALDGLEESGGFSVVKNLHPLPQIPLDREQML